MLPERHLIIAEKGTSLFSCHHASSGHSSPDLTGTKIAERDASPEMINTDKKISICMLVANFAPLQGGAERQAQQLSRALLRLGARVCILAGGTKEHGSLHIDGEVPVYRMGGAKSIQFALHCIAFLLRHRHQYDIIHVHTEWSPAVVAAAVGPVLSKPIVVKVRRSGPQAGLEQLQRTLWGKLRLAFLKLIVSRWIAISSWIERDLAELGVAGRTVRLPNAVDTTLVRPLSDQEKCTRRREMGIGSEAFVAVFVGALRARKRVDVLLQAWHELVRQGIEARLFVVGDGEAARSLQATVRHLNLDRYVTFTGRQPFGGVISYLQIADVFVLPSESEGLSNALLEAMAAGVAVISTRVSGSTDAIEDGINGLLVEVGDPRGLAEALKALAEQPVLRRALGIAARRRVEEYFSLDRIAEGYFRLYAELLS